MSGKYVGRKTEIDLYMEQRKAVFAYLQERSDKGKLNQYRVTVDEILQNINVDHGFSVRKQMKQFFIDQARKKGLNNGIFTTVKDSKEKASETTETEQQEESNSEEQTPIETPEETTETTTKSDSDGVGGTTDSND